MSETDTTTTRIIHATAASPEDRRLSVLAHMSSFLGYIIPFGQFLAPYTIQLLRGPESDFVFAHTREVLNFQITIVALLLAGLVLSPLGIGWLVIAATLAHSMWQTIRGARAASRTEPFEYPFTLRVLRDRPSA